MLKNLCMLLLIFISTVSASAGNKIDGTHRGVTDPGSVKGLKPGDIIILHGYTDSANDLELTIQAHHVLKGKGYESHILECSSNETVYIDIEGDKISIWAVEKDLNLKTLGISEKKLDKIDTKAKGSISYEGKEFFYEDSDEAIYYENGKEDERVYYWEFSATDTDLELLVTYFYKEDIYFVELIEELDLNEISISATQ